MITIALSKGRQLNDFIAYLKKQNLMDWVTPLEAVSRELVVYAPNMRFLLVKGDDVPVYVEERGAGELLVTSMDYDGMQQGFDHTLLSIIEEASSLPIIASGGAGQADHFVDLFLDTDVSAGLAASIFHDETVSIQEVKNLCSLKGVPMRHV
ncbi:HisA/HisF-related TIM barrel protein [Alkalibacterium sp. MB6]|uniref:HisA/HisF-related TIM barrel protein n=1 Tax=Alkalibacterium sp. MB6 TaxID=2081965 RepID=UPI00137A10F9